MATRVTALVRPLSAVVVDLATTRQRLACLEVSPREGDGYDDLESRRHALEAEFETAFFQETGVNWTLAHGVMN